MQKGWMLLTVCVMSSVLYAQDNLGKEDLLAAFETYNPSVLEEAARNAAYQEVLDKLLAAYELPRNEENIYQTIALVKNFDNSIRLHALQQDYFEKQTLAQMSGTELPGLNEEVLSQLYPIVKSIYQNTLDVYQLQIQDHKQHLKAVKKQPELSAVQKQEQVQAIKGRIRSIRQEIKKLRTNSSDKIQRVAQAYLGEMQSQYLRQQNLQTLQSSSRDIKANHKKPVAE